MTIVIKWFQPRDALNASLLVDNFSMACNTPNAMIIDPSKLQEDDLFVLSVVRHGGTYDVALTANVQREGRYLLRSPKILRPPPEIPGFPDFELVDALIGALPPLNWMPEGLTLRAERALCDKDPVWPDKSVSPSVPVDRLNARLMGHTMESLGTTMWRGFTRIEVRVVRGDNKRRPFEPAGVSSPRSPMPLVGSATAELEPVE